MTAPLNGVQRARLNSAAQLLDAQGLKTKAADLRHALDLIDTYEEALAPESGASRQATRKQLRLALRHAKRKLRNAHVRTAEVADQRDVARAVTARLLAGFHPLRFTDGHAEWWGADIDDDAEHEHLTDAEKAVVYDPRDACGRCGTNPAQGLAQIGEVRYCHGDDEQTSCYEQASWDRQQRLDDFVKKMVDRYTDGGS